MLENINVAEIMETYIIPTGINVLMAIVIYIIGKIVVGILVGVFGK
jgi:small conductance mechanosensitive channel